MATQQRIYPSLWLTVLLCASMSAMASAQELSTSDAARIIATTRDLIIIDVRTPEEYALGHIRGAMHVDYYDSVFAVTIGSLPKRSPIFVYGRKGRRCSAAVAAMKSAGFTTVYHLSGGIEEWKRKNMPLVKGK